MDLDAVELVNVEARRNRQLAVQDSLQARALASRSCVQLERGCCARRVNLAHGARWPGCATFSTVVSRAAHAKSAMLCRDFRRVWFAGSHDRSGHRSLHGGCAMKRTCMPNVSYVYAGS